jgi:molybdopterin converting factor small subunit
LLHGPLGPERHRGTQHFLIDGTRASRANADDITLREGAVIEVLPPFAGG